jgi:uncharacterized protein
MLPAMSDVLHVPDQNRFELRDGDEVAVLTYERGDADVALVHTVVPEALGGDGVGSRLAETAVRWAREQDLEVVPVCTFVQSWLERHPEALGS